MNKKIQALRGELIVSCQALPEEPLHSSYIMSKMAAAALEGGAKGIRVNTKGGYQSDSGRGGSSDHWNCEKGLSGL